MGKIRTFFLILLIFGAITIIPLLYSIANAFQSTVWGTSFLNWFADIERVVLEIVDAEDVGSGWELFIVALVLFLIPLCVYRMVELYDDVELIHKRSMVVEGVIQESTLSEKVGDYTTVYNVTITYQFTAEGKTLTQTNTLSDTWSSLYNIHQKRLKQYPPGAKIPLHYEPGNLDNNLFKKFDERSNIWMLVPFVFSGGFYALFTWLCGFFLTLYFKNFPSFLLDRQIITGLILVAILIVFFFYARWFYIRGFSKTGQKSNVLES